MTDSLHDLTLPLSEYEALLSAYPWIRSRDRYAEVSRGWVQLMVEMLGAMDLVMTEITATHPGAYVAYWSSKSKLGRLGIYFELRGARTEDWPALRLPVERAEQRSAVTCERCGDPGRRRDIGGWLTTLCERHALRP